MNCSYVFSSSLPQRPRKGEQDLRFRGGLFLSLAGMCSDEAVIDEIVWLTVNMSAPQCLFTKLDDQQFVSHEGCLSEAKSRVAATITCLKHESGVQVLVFGSCTR